MLSPRRCESGAPDHIPEEEVQMPGLRVAIALAVGGALGAANAAAQTPDGQALYRQNCRACHGGAGRPSSQMVAQFKNIPIISDPAFLHARSDDSLVASISNGGKDMKPFKGKLSREEMLAIVRYLRGLAPAKTP
jgi:mono/diheme cytochrome c family protein